MVAVNKTENSVTASVLGCMMNSSPAQRVTYTDGRLRVRVQAKQQFQVIAQTET